MPGQVASGSGGPMVTDPVSGWTHPYYGFGEPYTIGPGDPGHLELISALNDASRARAEGLPYREVQRIYDEGMARYRAAVAANPPPTVTQPSRDYYGGGFDAPHPLRRNWIGHDPVTGAALNPVAQPAMIPQPQMAPAAQTQAVPKLTSSVLAQSQPSQNLAQLLGQAQTAAPETVGRLPSGPSGISTSQPQQVSPLMQMFNFPRLRTKKPAQATSSTAPTGVGQYNENFWNAWRI